MPTVEVIKVRILALNVEDAEVARFTHTAQRTLGILLRATEEGYQEWATAVEALGGRPELHGGQRIRTGGYPPSFLYDLTVYVE